jgi:hypothetical protein
MAADSYDIAIYGSTSGAVAAAIQASRLGRKTVLISPHEHIGRLTVLDEFPATKMYIGGIQVEGLGSTDIDNQAELKNSPSIGGLGLELHQRLSKHYGRLDELEDVLAKGLKRPEVWKFESCVAEKVIKDWLAEYPALSIIKSTLVENEDAVQKEGNVVTSCKLADGQIIRAKVLRITLFSPFSFLLLITSSTSSKPHTKETSSHQPAYPQ